MTWLRKSMPENLFRMLASLAVVWTLAGSPPGHAADYGKFEEFTLYAKDGETASEFKADVIVALHGFGSAMPNRTYKIFYKAFHETHTVVGFNYDYVDVDRNRVELEELYEKFLRGRNLIIVGTSLGGFWADYFANAVGARGAILVNPVVDPRGLMRDMHGEHYSERREKTFWVMEKDAAAYEGVKPTVNPRTEMLVLLTRDDEVLPYEEAVRTFAGSPTTETVIFETGGHSPGLDRPDMMSVIRRFVTAHSGPDEN